MQGIAVLDKPVGITPLEMVQKFRYAHPELTNTKIGYAGRLDPLAHGVMLLMIGEETKNRNTHLSLQKSYQFETVFGLKTDTYDILGLLHQKISKPPKINVNIFVNKFVNKFIGTHKLAYPPYSSKTVKGKPLFWWAKNGKLSEIEIPTKEIEIFTFKIISQNEITNKELEIQVLKKIQSVRGDFRQKEITNRWHNYFSRCDRNKSLQKIAFQITCSTGTYIREIVNVMGSELGCGAIAIDILRTHVGKYSLKNVEKL